MLDDVQTAAAEKPPKRNRLRAAPSRQAFAYTVEDAQSMGAPGRTKLYELEARGQLKFIRVAGRTLVDGDSLRALLGVTEP